MRSRLKKKYGFIDTTASCSGKRIELFQLLSTPSFASVRNLKNEIIVPV